MVIIRLRGGMGNQMFQYAFGRRMAETLNTKLFLDLSLLLDWATGKESVYRDYELDIFNVDPQFIIPPNLLRAIYTVRYSGTGEFIRKWIARGRNYVKEPHFHVSEELLQRPQDNTIYQGWWQSERYFSEISDQIRRDFSFKDELLPKSQLLFDEIRQTNSIALHVRRTDYLKVPSLNTTDRAYFLQAAERIANKVSDPFFYVFSDDIEWCEQQIKLDYPVRIVGHDLKGHKSGNHLRLMAACKHFIISNSSFAWWAVWLSDNPDRIVIAPRNWFHNPRQDTSDLVPKNWMRM